MNTRTATSVLACGLLGACSVPTDLPVVDSRWILEVKSTTIGVDGLLPPGVTASGDAFVVEIDPVTEESSLAALCPECPATDGTPAPKPAFTGSITAAAELPPDLGNAELASGSVELRMQHNFGFDPLRPPGGSPGRLTATLAEAGGREVGRLTLNGATDSLPPVRLARRTIALAPGTIADQLTMAIEIESPAGGRDTEHRVPLQRSDRFLATVRPVDVRMSSAHVDVVGRRVRIVPAEIGVEGVDGGIVDRIQSGAIVLDVANSFRTGLQATMRILKYGEIVVSKGFTIGEAENSTVSLELTPEEFRSFLGQSGVRLSGSGIVTSPVGGIVVAPGMEVEINGKVDLTLRVGG